MWIPDSKGIYPDLLATSGDYLRVWRAADSETRLECLLNNVFVLIFISNCTYFFLYTLLFVVS